MWLYHTFMPYAHNSRSFTTILGQNLNFEPQNMPWGIPCLTGPQQKDHDSPSYHFVGIVIFVQNPSNYSWTV